MSTSVHPPTEPQTTESAPRAAPSRQERRRALASTALLVSGFACLLLALPCVFFGVLGLVGVAADMSLEENRRAGVQFLGISLIPALLGAALLLGARRLRPRNPG